jgi:hypothetical protein
VQLTRELAERGFTGSYDTVRRRVARWRRVVAEPLPSDSTASVAPGAVRCPSSNCVTWLLLDDEKNLTPMDNALLDALQRLCP